LNDKNNMQYNPDSHLLPQPDYIPTAADIQHFQPMYISKATEHKYEYMI
jgi:hypothetical protein